MMHQGASGTSMESGCSALSCCDPAPALKCITEEAAALYQPKRAFKVQKVWDELHSAKILENRFLKTEVQ